MFKKEIYLNRRNNLLSKFTTGKILLLGNIENPINFEHNTYPFRQDSSFLYYIGIKSPRLAAVLDAEKNETILFGDEMTIDDIVWMGQQQTLAEKADLSGIDKILPFNQLFDYLSKGKQEDIHYLPPYQSHNKLLLEQLTGRTANQLTPSVALIKAVVAHRSIL
ncbi:MAG TPA: Xaa-Pro aminopeptidase, partial [Sphingobacterium sp.]|nr:Xaa-Pro aminopeptidase [Sphingobacterium sp.]